MADSSPGTSTAEALKRASIPEIRIYNPPWHPTGMSVMSFTELERMLRMYAPSIYPVMEAVAKLPLVKEQMGALRNDLHKQAVALDKALKEIKAALPILEDSLFCERGTLDGLLPNLDLTAALNYTPAEPDPQMDLLF